MTTQLLNEKVEFCQTFDAKLLKDRHIVLQKMPSSRVETGVAKEKEPVTFREEPESQIIR